MNAVSRGLLSACVSLRPHLAFDPRLRRLSTPPRRRLARTLDPKPLSAETLRAYKRLPGRLSAIASQLEDVLTRSIPSEGRMARVSVALGVRSIVEGGAGIAIDHPLAGTGKRMGKVRFAAQEVDDDPAGMRLKRGRQYVALAKKLARKGSVAR